jgi:hypothetical protein
VGTLLDSSKSQHVVWAAQLDSGGRAWSRKPPEKRKVGSSILPLTTSFGQVSRALISGSADPVLSYQQLSSDRAYPYVTVVSRSLSPADRTARRRAVERGLRWAKASSQDAIA